MTGQERLVEVQYHCCHEGVDHISRIREPGVCYYVIEVHSSKFCGLIGESYSNTLVGSNVNIIHCYISSKSSSIDKHSNSHSSKKKLQTSIP